MKRRLMVQYSMSPGRLLYRLNLSRGKFFRDRYQFINSSTENIVGVLLGDSFKVANVLRGIRSIV
jgi:hypothetical protein